MTGTLAFFAELFKLLWISYDGTATDGAVVAMANVIITNELLMLPVSLMLVGLVVGIFTRIINSVRG